MGIHFSPERWEKIQPIYRTWWAGELDRPLIAITLGGYNPGRPEPELPAYGFHSFYDPSVPVEKIIDRIGYDLSGQRFFGDAFPSFWPNFGPGVAAAFLGAQLQNGKDTVWFLPPEERGIADLHFQLDMEAFWFQRVAALMQAGIDRWQGLVQIGMTDLGGNLDLLSTFRPGEKLLLDLYDHPEEVRRLTWEAHEAWWGYFDALNEILQPVNPGYTAWTPIFSEQPYYMLQCDFAFMVGPQMFDEFVKPELTATCRRLTHPFFHLDGPGQLPHLDSLLDIPELKGIQWVPGAGAPDVTQWPDVYRRVRAAGKLIQVFTSQTDQGFQVVDILADQLGSAEGLIIIGSGSRDQEPEVLELLRRYGVT